MAHQTTLYYKQLTFTDMSDLRDQVTDIWRAATTLWAHEYKLTLSYVCDGAWWCEDDSDFVFLDATESVKVSNAGIKYHTVGESLTITPFDHTSVLYIEIKGQG